MSKKMPEIDRMCKYYSVKCNCGHRVCFARKTIFKICPYCGTKYLSPREVFKLRLKAYLKKS